MAENVVCLIMMLCRARRGAVFACRGDQLQLLASRGLDQHAFDLVERLWGSTDRSLSSGSPHYSAGPESFVVIPALDSRRSSILSLLYADTPDPLFRLAPAHVATFASILAWPLQVEDTPAVAEPDEWPGRIEAIRPEDVERQRLVSLLERNEWNVSRVARLIGVARMTVYHRLQRLRIERRRVPKGRSAT